ncbi:hypothetical protein ACFLRF_03765 [Candidatus Altiarchaeota archaeon]
MAVVTASPGESTGGGQVRLGRAEMNRIMRRMPVDERREVISQLALRSDDSLNVRDRLLASDYYVSGSSYEELYKKYGVGGTTAQGNFTSLNGVKNALGEIAVAFVASDAAQGLGSRYKAWEDSVPAMPWKTVRQKMKTLDPGQQLEIINNVPTDTWKKRSAVDEHRQIALKYLYALRLDPDTSVARFHKDYYPGSSFRMVNVTLDKMWGRISVEAELRQKIRAYTGELDESAELPQPKVVSTPAPKPGIDLTVPVGDLKSIDEFDSALRQFGNKFSNNWGNMIKASGLETRQMKQALASLPKGKPSSDVMMELSRMKGEFGRRIPFAIGFLHTQPAETLAKVASHLEDSLVSFISSTGLQDNPRIALYASMAEHMGQHPVLAGQDKALSDRFGQLKADYGRLPLDLPGATAIKDDYNITHSMYARVLREISSGGAGN